MEAKESTIQTIRPITFKQVDDLIRKIVREEINLGNVSLKLNPPMYHSALLEYLKGIHSIDLSFTNITDDQLKYLEGAHTIYLTGCENITDAGMKHLKGVHILDITETGITDAGLKHLKGVNTIYLMDTEITEKGKEFLKTTGTSMILD